VVAALACACLWTVPAAAEPAVSSTDTAGSYEATLNRASGEVSVEYAAAPGVRKPARAGTGLSAKDVVRTGKNGRAEIALVNYGLIELQPNATMVINSLEKADASFTLRLGALLSKLRSLGGRRLRVRSSRAVASVRGTEFAVEAKGDGAAAYFAVFDEGVVDVEAEGHPAVTLESNLETAVRPGEAPAAPHAIDHFKFAQQRMRILRQRARYFGDQWHRKYRIPKTRGAKP
jgi:hypothetical protein